MRIIAGTFRSRTLEAPPGLATRPTSDRLRETLFNVLTPRIEGSRFLDLFAGSGAVGLEALSRGAQQVALVERAQPALKILRANAKKLGVEDAIHVRPGLVTDFLKHDAGPWDLVFLDPPYDAEEEYEKTLRSLGASNHLPRSEKRDPGHPTFQLLAPGALVIAEHRRKQKLNDAYGKLRRTRLLEQGDAALSFYGIEEDAPGV
jgi:16S rRNA (guanine966-N2)-methyltransferase